MLLSLRLKSCVALKWTSKHLDVRVPFIFLVLVHHIISLQLYFVFVYIRVRIPIMCGENSRKSNDLIHTLFFDLYSSYLVAIYWNQIERCTLSIFKKYPIYLRLVYVCCDPLENSKTRPDNTDSLSTEGGFGRTNKDDIVNPLSKHASQNQFRWLFCFRVFSTIYD